MVVRAGALILSPLRIATVRAVLLVWPPVMMPCGSGTIAPSYKKTLTHSRREQRADVSFEYKIRLAGALDSFLQLRIRGVSQVADLTADSLLPLGQGFDVDVDPWVRVVSRHCLISYRFKAVAPGVDRAQASRKNSIPYRGAASA